MSAHGVVAKYSRMFVGVLVAYQTRYISKNRVIFPSIPFFRILLFKKIQPGLASLQEICSIHC